MRTKRSVLNFPRRFWSYKFSSTPGTILYWENLAHGNRYLNVRMQHSAEQLKALSFLSATSGFQKEGIFHHYGWAFLYSSKRKLRILSFPSGVQVVQWGFFEDCQMSFWQEEKENAFSGLNLWLF